MSSRDKLRSTKRTAPSEVGATVRRVGKIGASTKIQRAELARFIKEPYLQYSKDSARTAELTKKAFAPFQKIIKEYPKSIAAFVDLRKHRRSLLMQSKSPQGGQRTFDGPEPPIPGDPPFPITNVHPGVNVFASPFDYSTVDEVGYAETSINRDTGYSRVYLTWDDFGIRTASAGVGLHLRAEVSGIVRVRPAWRYDFRAFTDGFVGSLT